MSLPCQPSVGEVVRCDFRGMVEPEMVKVRDVVVIAKHPHNPRLVTVVPLSATQPRKQESYHHELPQDPRPDGDALRPIWAKCDMLYTVSTERLSRHHTRTRRGGRQWVKVALSADDVAAIHRGVASALGLTDN